jgi:hypothetical protein
VFHLFIAFLLPVLIGYNLLSLAIPVRTKSLPGARFFILFAGVGAGLGITSTVYFCSLSVSLPLGRLPVLEIGLLSAILIARAFLTKRGKSTGIKEIWILTLQSPGPFLLFVLVFGFVCLHFYTVAIKGPIGGWDAYAQWNLKALFLYRGPDHWEDIFNLESFHAPDYPLLLAGAVARGWTFLGFEDPIVPQIIALLYFLSVIGALVFAVSLFRSPSEGWLAGAVLCSIAEFPRLAALQLADIPTALYLLCGICFYLLGLSSLEIDRRSFALSGFFFSLAVWTKNEGWLVIYAFFVSRIVISFFSTPRAAILLELGAFILGALPMAILAISYYRYALIMTENPLPVGLLANSTQILNPPRWGTVIWTCLWAPSSLNGIVVPSFVLFLFIRGRRYEEREKDAILTVGLTLTMTVMGYLLVYVNSGHDLPTYIVGNWWRLLLQLIPSFIFLGFLISSDPRNRHPPLNGENRFPSPLPHLKKYPKG